MDYIFSPCKRKKRILHRSSLVAVGDDILSEILDYSSSLDLIVFQRVSKVNSEKNRKKNISGMRAFIKQLHMLFAST